MMHAARAQTAGDRLFDAIGAFLAHHRLSGEPDHYAFAYRVLSDPDSPTARAVAELTEGGIRLTAGDIVSLGGTVVAAPGVEPTHKASAQLAAETRAQVEEFAGLVRTMRDEARGFGRDLADSAAAITRVPSAGEGRVEITRIADAMIARIRSTEDRLAQATAEAEELRTKLADARDAARRDSLTGLPNRMAFDETLAEYIRAGGPLCIALCDVDRFKAINDRHGHGVGDRVLVAIGNVLGSACGPHLVARYGGEEFAVLIRGLDLTTATELLDEARATIAAKRFRVRETASPLGRITLSAGVVALRIDEVAEAVLARADSLLYAAKDNGRDAVCAA